MAGVDFLWNRVSGGAVTPAITTVSFAGMTEVGLVGKSWFRLSSASPRLRVSA